MNRRLLSHAALAAMTVMVSAGLIAGPAHAAEPSPTPVPHASDVNVARALAACDPRGTTPSDASVATQLNGTLRAKMRGYMSAYRVSCARMVIKAVHDRGLNPRAAVIAITTTIVETSIDNISEELDHDSLGLFQQRASWGSRDQRLNPTWAANAFLNKMISKYPNNGWMTAQIGQVCQAVQVSAYPDRYQPQAADAQLIVNAIWPMISAPVEGRLYREPSGTIAVVAGGAPVRFSSMEELNASGYEGAPFTNVPAGWLNTLPQSPRDGTYLRNAADGGISVIAGGAKYGLSHPEWTALGQPASINVPIRLINTYGAVPRNGTYLRNHANGNIVIIAGSAKYSLTAAQYDTLGKPAFTNVPIGFINRIGTDPTNGTYLRNPVTASVYLTVGGAKHGLSYDEWIALGQPAPTNVPIEWINTFGAIPRNGTYLRNPVDSSIYAITNNHKKALSYDEWAALGKPDSTNVPINYLNTIPNV
ncbi:hypothetical protein OG339_45225 [Streptosporangium sp. NBC_01495]|uniref:hypothetical protein n=1 Tax=Streptosporangium sp. NBC_01495 TaxID=2903899 RepID=UPI002E302A77|nr:hypothetical protein [Streptosporangium sp. NBC_01495]